MSAAPQQKMTVDEYLAWAEGQPGRYELYAGSVYAMAPERAIHAEVKFATQSALAAAIRVAGVPCRMMPDGMTIRVDEHTAHEPDALVYCGERLPPASIEVPDPMILVEVSNCLPAHTGPSLKLAGYFTLPSVRHFLIVEPEETLVIHHARGEGDTIVTRILRDGVIRLDPPGIEVAVADLYPADA